MVELSDNSRYVITPDATVTWTSVITGDVISRTDGISLFLDNNITQSAVYTLFLSTDT